MFAGVGSSDVDADGLVDGCVVCARRKANSSTPFYTNLTCYQVLVANHNQGERADMILAQDRWLLQTYAAEITETGLRRSFFAGVAAHQVLMGLYGVNS